MSKVVETPLGGDGGKAGLYLEEGMIVAKVGYPIASALKPITSVVDSMVDKLEALIPGDQKAAAEVIKAQYKAELAKAIEAAGKVG